MDKRNNVKTIQETEGVEYGYARDRASGFSSEMDLAGGPTSKSY